MGAAQNKLQKRRKAKDDIAKIFNQAGIVYVIHYSCESFYNRTDGSSPRITSIAVRNLENAQTISFSIHQVAERNKITPAAIEQNYDSLEKKMLSEFYGFVERHSNSHWVHWNMRDINYGFAAIEHRFKVLGGKPKSISETHLFDLNRILFDVYGSHYADHPRFSKVMEMNNITKKDFLTGDEEAVAFTQKEYVKLHQSTLRKVDILANIAGRVWDESLITNSGWREQYGTSLLGIVEAAMDTTLFKVLGLAGILITAVSFAIQIIQLLQTTKT